MHLLRQMIKQMIRQMIRHLISLGQSKEKTDLIDKQKQGFTDTKATGYRHLSYKIKEFTDTLATRYRHIGYKLPKVLKTKNRKDKGKIKQFTDTLATSSKLN